MRDARALDAGAVLVSPVGQPLAAWRHRKRESALESVALRDELTGLYNRRGWFVLADHELERARRHRHEGLLRVPAPRAAEAGTRVPR